jgi:outer membrane protein, heavy metal efflux system
MARHVMLCGAAIAVTTLLWGPRADAQITSLADDIVIISKGQQERQKAQTETHLGVIHGTSERPFAFTPGSGESRLGGLLGPRPSGFTALNRDVLSAASGLPEPLPNATERPGIAPTPALPSPKVPLYGTLDVPSASDEGPPDGLTLDMAIDRLLRANYDLRTKFQEIPKSQADILTAGLRANPLIFASFDNVPYGNYSPQRPGQNGYSVTLIQPFDVNRKRLARIVVAQQAKKVLEAQYQDAVRREIDNLYTAFVNVLEAREAVRYARVGLGGLGEVSKVVQEQYQKGNLPAPELDAALIQRDTAEVGLEEAEVALQRAQKALAVVLGIPSASADRLEVRGTIRDTVPPPPPVEDLIRFALCSRPDVIAYRLGVRSAEANVKLQKKEVFPDVFALYTPYGFTNFAPENQKSTTAWGVAVFASIPLLNRNQGNIRRAEHTVLQTKIELSGLEQQVVAEMQQAALEYGKSRDVLQRFEQGILPRARRMRDAKYRLYTQGQGSVLTYLEGQRQFNEVVRQYLDALIRHRRSMLRLNTAVGQRILP